VRESIRKRLVFANPEQATQLADEATQLKIFTQSKRRNRTGPGQLDEAAFPAAAWETSLRMKNNPEIVASALRIGGRKRGVQPFAVAKPDEPARPQKEQLAKRRAGAVLPP